MLSYMIPVEEHSPNRNLSLNLNNITATNNGNNHSSSDMMSNNTTTTIITINNLQQDNVNDLCDEDLIDENTKLLMSYEKKQANGDAIMKPNLQQQQKNQKNKIVLKNKNCVTNYCDDNNEIQKKNNGHVITSATAIKSDNNVEFLGSKLKSLKKNMEDQKQQQEQSQKVENQQQKKVTLKRVSFGSSKGSMVETVVYETPTPVSEYPERFIGNYHTSSSHHNAVPVHQNGNHLYHQHHQTNETNPNVASASTSLNDSGIAEMQQEEIERSKVRVSFFENSKPQVISSPEFNSLILYGDTVFGDTFANSQEVYVNGDLVQYSGAGDLLGNDENSNKMATLTEIPPNYDRQQSTDSGWDNPFRPDGDLSKEADEIVNLIKGGKPITPTSENHLNGNALKDSVITENGTTVVDGAVKSEAKHLQSSKSPQKSSAANTTTATKNGDTQQISNQVIPGPQSATNVVIDDKKKKKRCCVIQ